MFPAPWPARSGALVLRDPRPDELDGLAVLRNDPAVNRFMLRTHVEPEEFRREWSTVPGSDTDFSCVAEHGGRTVGLGFLDVLDGLGQPGMPRGTQGRIGYVLDPSAWGRGLGTDLARGLLSAAFDVLGLRRVTASCNADNPASVRVLEKAGMRREQHGVQDSWHAELGWVDGYEYALLAPEWAALHPTGAR
ncbi:GNAT family N-acetyltransferase [Kineococcus sp. LSe6-4]|uniref:GNAT family N-acetyltransferase n=1 Tax=Kineococcus halophytocola TaxID=3234027 RepID=A0ABV4H616_9ACTN